MKNPTKNSLANLDVEVRSLKLTINVGTNEAPRALLRVLIDHVLDKEKEDAGSDGSDSDKNTQNSLGL